MPYSRLTTQNMQLLSSLSELLPKVEGYSLNIPLNRQQKGFDLLVYSSISGKSEVVS